MTLCVPPTRSQPQQAEGLNAGRWRGNRGRLASALWGVSCVAMAACGGPDTVDVVPDAIEKVVATDAQSAPAGGTLPAPLAVSVRQADGSVAPRGAVRWTITAGSGAVLSDSVTLADGNGQAQVVLRLGSATGTYTVRAELKGKPSRNTSLAATATPPPTVTGVMPAQFTGGDTVVVQGSAFDPSASVDIAGTPARVLSVSGAGTAITLTVPVCLAPGPVAVQAWVRTAPSNQVSATFTAAVGSVRLAVADYAAIEPNSVTGCARFPAAGFDSIIYLLAPQSVSETPGDSTSYRLLGDAALASPPIAATARPLPLALRFHDGLRRLEQEYAKLPREHTSGRALEAAPAVGLSVGQQRTFRVCSIVTCSQPQDFTQVTAVLRYVSNHAAIYQDVAAPANGFTDTDFQSLGQLFDTDLYGVDTEAFGVESDVDANGLVFILFTPVVNRLTPKSQCSESYITGFQFSVDIDPAFKGDSRSNQAEVFYAIVPDPDETVTCRFTVSAVRRFVPVTFIHEFQHMINFYHHVVLRGGGAEALWLNEAMSHLAEELGGWHFRAQGDQSRFSDFVLGDLVNAFLYLKAPAAQHTLFAAGTGTLEERGAAWLFLRWILDQFGDQVTRSLSETGLIGTANVAAATGEPAAKLLPQWFLANYVSDLPGFTAPGRLMYKTWAFRATFADLHNQLPSQFDRPFPLVPPTYFGGNFDRTGFLRAGSGDYFLALQIPGQEGFGLQFTRGSGAVFDPSDAVRLDVVRIR